MDFINAVNFAILLLVSKKNYINFHRWVCLDEKFWKHGEYDKNEHFQFNELKLKQCAEKIIAHLPKSSFNRIEQCMW